MRATRTPGKPSRRAFLAGAAATGALACTEAFRIGPASDDGWSTAISILTAADPHSVFSNPFLDTLFG